MEVYRKLGRWQMVEAGPARAVTPKKKPAFKHVGWTWAERLSEDVMIVQLPRRSISNYCGNVEDIQDSHAE